MYCNVHVGKGTFISRNENIKCHKRKIKLCPLAAPQIQFSHFVSILEDFSICIWRRKQRSRKSVRKSIGNNILSEKNDKRTTSVKAT